MSQAQLDTAISGTSANTNALSTLDIAFADPDLETLRQKLHELFSTGGVKAQPNARCNGSVADKA